MSLAREFELQPALRPHVALDYPRRRPTRHEGALTRRRPIPLGATTLVSVGDEVQPSDPIARFTLTGRAHAVDIASALGLPPERVAAAMVRRSGETVAEGDILAERRSLGGLQRRAIRSPAAGRISYISPPTGIAYIEPGGLSGGLIAHLGGRITSVDTDCVAIEGEALAVAGSAGAGPAACGVLIVADSAGAVPERASGGVVACAFAIDESTVRRVADSDAVALVAAGIEEEALDRLGWHDVLWPDPARRAAGPAPPMTVVLIDSTSSAPDPSTWEMLRSSQGRFASALGAEPGCSPELLVSLDGSSHRRARRGREAPPALSVGRQVRAIAGRAQGFTGDIADLSDGPYRLPSEVRADAAVVVFPYGVRLAIPLVHLQVVR
jgi:hypothetical protein